MAPPDPARPGGGPRAFGPACGGRPGGGGLAREPVAIGRGAYDPFGMLPRTFAIALLLLAGCGGRGLRLTLIDASVQRPSNIAVYFTVDTSDGEPVPNLTAESFRIYEDDQPVSILESKQTILNPEVAASHFTLLLVDMSGSVAGSGDVPVIVDSARAFSERVQKYQRVAVYVFDGSSTIQQISGFSSAGVTGLDRLTQYKPRDPSTNLYGAVIEGLKVLARQMTSSSTSLTFGTLVVFTDGTDRAGRVPREKLHELLDETSIDVIVMGVGQEIDAGELRAIGRKGAIVSKDRGKIAESFNAAAAKIEGASKRYYLLGYCSPARAGEHTLRIEAKSNGRTGSYEHKFNAQGFGPNCDPKQPPSFSLKRPKRLVVR